MRLSPWLCVCALVLVSGCGSGSGVGIDSSPILRRPEKLVDLWLQWKYPDSTIVYDQLLRVRLDSADIVELKEPSLQVLGVRTGRHIMTTYTEDGRRFGWPLRVDSTSKSHTIIIPRWDSTVVKPPITDTTTVVPPPIRYVDPKMTIPTK